MAAISMRGDWDIRAASRIRSRFRSWRPDIVHAHDARSHALAMLALVGRKNLPLVVTRRVTFTPHSVRLKYGSRVARFIAISQAVKSAMVAGGIDGERIEVVHSGVLLPTAVTQPRNWRAELGWPDDSVVLGVVGAMTAEKGTDTLESVARMLDNETRSRARIVLIGGDAKGSAGIGGIPAFRAGFVDAIEQAVSGLDVLLHPSRLEGLGTAVLDAMMLGVPPVAFAVGGLPEVIIDGESGLLAAPGDAAGFASSAAALIRDEGLRRRIGEGAKERAKTFQAAEMTKGTEAVYYRVLAG